MYNYNIVCTTIHSLGHTHTHTHTQQAATSPSQPASTVTSEPPQQMRERLPSGSSTRSGGSTEAVKQPAADDMFAVFEDSTTSAQKVQLTCVYNSSSFLVLTTNKC